MVARPIVDGRTSERERLRGEAPPSLRFARAGRGRGSLEEPWRPLTAREFEVSRLIGGGLTNAEIAEELTISPKTASAHVEHILAKLGATRCAEIAAWAATILRSNRPDPIRASVAAATRR